MVDYGSHSGSSSSNEDVKLSTMPYSAIEAEFDGLREGNSDFGQSLGERYENTTVVDGALFRRNDDSSKLKLYSWKSLGFDAEEEELKPQQFVRKTENYAGNTYEYTMVAATVDETGTVWTNENTDMEVNENGLPEIGNAVIWNGGSTENGPNSTAKTAARTLSDLGRGAVTTEDDVFNWFNSSAEARPQLVGRRIRRFKVEREGDTYNFYTPVFIDVATGDRIGISNDESPTPADNSTDDTVDNSTDERSVMEQAAEEATSDDDEGFSAPVDDCIEYCVEQNMTGRDEVLGTFRVMQSNPNSSISTEMIEEAGQDNIMEAIKARAE
jgi:hypothetical protein